MFHRGAINPVQVLDDCGTARIVTRSLWRVSVLKISALRVMVQLHRRDSLVVHLFSKSLRRPVKMSKMRLLSNVLFCEIPRIGEKGTVCRWLRREEPAPQVLELPDGQVVTQPASTVHHLFQHWKVVFGQQDGTTADLQDFWQKYGDHLQAPSTPFPALCVIKSRAIRQAVRKMAHSVGG